MQEMERGMQEGRARIERLHAAVVFRAHQSHNDKWLLLAQAMQEIERGMQDGRAHLET